MITKDNNIKTEVSTRIQLANKGYYGLESLEIEGLIQKPKNQNVHDSTKTNCSIQIGNVGVEENRRIKINDILKKFYRKFSAPYSIDNLMNGENFIIWNSKEFSRGQI